MRLPCAWCESEVKPALIAQVESRDNPTPTHGMCPTHREQAEREIEALRLREAQRAADVDKDLKALREKVDP